MHFTRRAFVAGGLAAGALTLLPGRPLFAQAGVPTVDEVLNDPANPVLGNPEGDVTLVEYFDYQCPYCKKNHPMVHDVVQSDGNIRFVMKDWPIFGPASEYASRLSLGAASMGQYETANSALMATKGRLTDDQIDKVLTEAGIDIKAAEAAYKDNADKWEGFIKRNMRQAEAFGLNGTPTYIVGTTLFPGVVDRATLEEAIASARG